MPRFAAGETPSEAETTTAEGAATNVPEGDNAVTEGGTQTEATPPPEETASLVLCHDVCDSYSVYSPEVAPPAGGYCYVHERQMAGQSVCTALDESEAACPGGKSTCRIPARTVAL